MALPDDEARQSTRERLAFSLESDPGGSFIAERAGIMLGLSQALEHEQLWVLSSLAVSERARGDGVGRALLERAFAYGDPDAHRLIVSSNDPSALALYAELGLDVRPTVQAQGSVRRAAARLGAGFREGTARDVAALAPLSRAIRGAAHTREILFALARGGARLLLGEDAFSVVRPGHGVWLLVALEEEQAALLLQASLARAGECDRPIVRWVTEEQQWALEVLDRAGLAVSRYGALCVGGQPGPLRPFIPSGPFA